LLTGVVETYFGLRVGVDARLIMLLVGIAVDASRTQIIEIITAAVAGWLDVIHSQISDDDALRLAVFAAFKRPCKNLTAPRRR
jgi:hypothetical protein